MTHKEYWDKLEELSKLDDIKPFFKFYADYLKKHNIISREREVLYRAIKKVKEI